jgi:hypothetical protein
MNLSSKIVRRGLLNLNRQLSISKKSFQRPETTPNVFDRQAKLKQRERTCLDPEHNIYSYVHERVARSVVDRIFDIKR